VLLMVLNQCSGINTIMYYSGVILSRLYSEETAVWLAASCDAAQLLGVCISLYTVDAHGRRRTALRSCACVTLCLALLSLAFHLGRTTAPHVDTQLMNGAWSTVVVVLMMLYLVSFGAGLSGVAWVVVAEIYPMHVRAVGVGQAVLVNWLCNYAVAQSFLSLSDTISYAGSFALYASVAGIGGLLLYVYLPETAGLRLEAVDDLFRDPYPTARARGGTGKTEASALLASSNARPKGDLGPSFGACASTVVARHEVA
jgi:MFS family permease